MIFQVSTNVLVVRVFMGFVLMDICLTTVAAVAAGWEQLVLKVNKNIRHEKEYTVPNTENERRNDLYYFVVCRQNIYTTICL